MSENLPLLNRKAVAGDDATSPPRSIIVSAPPQSNESPHTPTIDTGTRRSSGGCPAAGGESRAGASQGSAARVTRGDQGRSGLRCALTNCMHPFACVAASRSPSRSAFWLSRTRWRTWPRSRRLQHQFEIRRPIVSNSNKNDQEHSLMRYCTASCKKS